MGGISSFVNAEKKSWIEHTLAYDESVRNACLEQLGLFKNGSKIYLTWVARTYNYVTFEHWFVTNGIHHFEFGTPDISLYNARVLVSSGARVGYKRDPDDKMYCKEMNDDIRYRMRQILGMSNYSLCLRNCEHVANYVFRGRWFSKQMVREGGLLSRFRQYLLGDNARMVNTFPSKLRKATEGEATSVYSFTKDHYTFCRLDYFLDYEEDTYNVLVVGPTGAGKSHLINVCFNQEVCRSDASHRSVTKDFCFVRGRGPVYDFTARDFVERNIVVTDTIGFCDTEWKDKDVLSLIRSRVSVNFKHIDAVCVVFRADRLIQDFVDSVQQIMKWLDYHNNENYLRFVFICTYAENLDDAKKAEMAEEASEIFKLRNFGQRLHNDVTYESLIYTGFPPEDALNSASAQKVQDSWSKVRRQLIELPEVPRLSVSRQSGCTIL